MFKSTDTYADLASLPSQVSCWHLFKPNSTSFCEPSNALIPGVQINNPVKRSDGFYTIGSMDINFSIPNNRIIGCSADCGDLNYPDPVPGNSSIIPITTASP